MRLLCLPAGSLQNTAPGTCRRGAALLTVAPHHGTDSPRAAEKAEAPEGAASGRYCSRNRPAEGPSHGDTGHQGHWAVSRVTTGCPNLGVRAWDVTNTSQGMEGGPAAQAHLVHTP